MRRSGGVMTEWVGGRFTARFYVEEPHPHRPDVILGLELPSGLLVGAHVDEGGCSADAVAARLAAFLARPMTAGAARPARIRVADAAVAAALRKRLGAAVPVAVAPTPELDDVFEHFSERVGGGGSARTYTERGRIPPADVARLFAAAERLWRAAPWKTAAEDQVLAVDVPALGVAGGCLSIIGALGENLGFVLFDSVAGFARFRDSMPDDGVPLGPIDLGGYVLSLNFERRSALPGTMKREIASHGWRVAAPAACPVLTTVDPDGVPRPATIRDVRLATVCADALAAFHERHPWVFASPPPAPVVDELTVDAGGPTTVRIEAPHPEAVIEIPTPSVALPRVGRNDPCPCGSGRKYKKCHLAAGEELARPTPAAALHERDRRLAAEMRRFAEQRWPAAWTAALDRLVQRDPEGGPQISVPWLLYHERFDGRPVVEWFVDARGTKLPAADRDWLDAQRAAHVAVCEVVGVAPGEVTFRDLLSGERRAVVEHAASEALATGDAVLTRLVSHAGVSVITMLYPQPLRPSEGEEVVRAGRRAAGTRARIVPSELLRDDRVACALLDTFTAVARRRRATAANLRLHNTDGHAVLLTTDHFDVEPAARAALLARLAELAERDDEESAVPAFRFAAPAAPESGFERVTVGVARLDERGLRIETNSRERADALRARVETACAGIVLHRAREHADPRSVLTRDAQPEPLDDGPSGPELDAMLVEAKRRHYATWPDAALPALRGLTPREAVRTAKGRHEVALLLRDMEHGEARVAAGQRFDFGDLRARLGIGERGDG